MNKGADNRGEDRANVFLVGTLHDVRGSTPVRIRNISVRGALVDGAKLPALGTKVRLARGRLSAAGEIAWRQNEMAGLNFNEQIDVDAWVQRVGHDGQQRIDRVVAALRGTDQTEEPIDPRVPPSSLIAISTELDEICERLACARDLSIQMSEELLRLDALSQSLRRLAKRG